MPAVLSRELEAQLAEDMARFFDDPLGWVLYAYDWSNDPNLQVCKLPAPWSLVYDSEWGPDAWACELLDDIGKQVREHGFDGRTSVPAIREAVASGHGIGKSAVTAWIVGWIMSTRPFARGTVTATTNQQLSTRTWAEVAKWNKRCITGHWFDVSTSRGAMIMKHRQHPDAWFCSAQSCDEHNSEAFAGQHAVNSSSFYIFDESSGVPDATHTVAEGGLTDGEPMMFAFGNPTQNTGWFAECFKSQRHRWRTWQIDSRDVQITNKQHLQDMIDDYGIDSDRVKVRVRGMFPALSAKQFFSAKDLDAAFGRHLEITQYAWAPKILTLDPAWEGDDELVFGLRQGLKFDILGAISKNDNDIEIAQKLAQFEDDHEADAVFVDAGYGTGIVSAGDTWGRDWQLVWFAGESANPGCLNKRAEMYEAARLWLKSGGALPKDHRLYNEAMAIETVARDDGKIQIESKKDLKKRLKLIAGSEGESASPNRCDAWVLSFAYPVQAKMPTEFEVVREARLLEQQRRGHDPYRR